MKKDVLIIGDLYFDIPKFVNGYRITHISLIKKIGKFKSLKRAYYLRTKNLKVCDYFDLEGIQCQAAKSDIVILFDGTTNFVLSEVIDKIERGVTHNRTKLYFFFWNTIITFNGLKFSNRWNICTYDKNDAIKFGLRYIGGFYSVSKSFLEIQESNLLYDLIFVGTDKGRFDYIRQLESTLHANNLKTKFIYVDPIKSKYSKKYTAPISYVQSLEEMSKSRAILDIIQVGQTGLTLRIYEGLFYNKKVITNNKEIVQHKFYHPNNILVIDTTTTINIIKNFLDSDFHPVLEEVKKVYHFSSWLDRVIEPNCTLDF